MRTIIFGAALGGAALIGLQAHPMAAQQDPIVGTWALNVDASDNPRDVMQAMRRGGQPGRRAGGSGGMGGRGADGNAARRGPGGDRGGPMSFIMRPANRVTIEMSGSDFSVANENQPTMLLYTDRETWSETHERFGEVAFKITHENGELAVERKFETSGMTLMETYQFNDDNDRLEISSRLSGGNLRQDLQIKRVYDKVVVQR